MFLNLIILIRGTMLQSMLTQYRKFAVQKPQVPKRGWISTVSTTCVVSIWVEYSCWDTKQHYQYAYRSHLCFRLSCQSSSDYTRKSHQIGCQWLPPLQVHRQKVRTIIENSYYSNYMSPTTCTNIYLY